MRSLPLASALVLLLATPSLARAATVPWVDVEIGRVTSVYNDVRIPGDGGTLFSLTDDFTTAPAPYARLKAGVAFGRHEISALYAPLRLTAEGVAPREIHFYGATIPAGAPVQGSYRFDSHRLGYRYALVEGGPWEVAVGFTAKIRDAAIGICSGSCTVRYDTGFVPLASLRVHWAFVTDFGLLLDAEGLGGGPGRAEDVLLAVTWRASDQVQARAGWRFVEGGADVPAVYTFAMLSYFGAGMTVRF